MANYCIWCGKEIKKDEVKCPECGRFQESYDKPWKDFLRNNVKEQLKSNLTDKVFGLLTSFIKSHIYGTVFTLSVVFTVTSATTYVAKANDIKLTDSNGQKLTFSAYEEVTSEPFTELVTEETARTIAEAAGIADMSDVENAENELAEGSNINTDSAESSGLQADPEYIGSYKLAGIYGSGEDTLVISMYTDFFEESTPGEEAGIVSELRIGNSVLVSDNYLVTTETPNVFTIPNTDYTVAFKTSGSDYTASIYNDMGTCIISFDSTVKYNDDDAYYEEFTSNNIDDYTINDVEFFIGNVLVETPYYLGPSTAFDTYEDVASSEHLVPGSQVMVYGQCQETGWWRVDLGRSGSYPVLYVPMDSVEMP